MFDFSQFLEDLAKAKNLDDLNRLEAEFHVEKTKPDFIIHADKLVTAIKPLDPALGIPFLIRLYNSEKSYNHDELIRAIITAEWIEGMKYLIDQDPNVVNISWNKAPLLSYLTSGTVKDKAFIQLILDQKPNLSLCDSLGNTFLHLFPLSGCNSEVVFDYVLNNLDQALFNKMNKKGITPLMNVRSKWGREVFIPKMKETIIRRFGQEALNEIIEEALSRAPLSAIGDRYLSSTPGEREAYIREKWTAEVPSLTPIMMLTSLIGKGLKREEATGVPMNVKLFPNIETLAQYIKTKAKASQDDFIVNGILILSLGAHSVNVFCIKSNDSLNVIVIDSLGDKGMITTTLPMELQNMLEDSQLTVQTLRSGSQIQFTSVGCKIISSYLAEKLSRLTVESAKELYDTLKGKADKSQSVRPADFPLWLGVLVVAQSMSLIEDEKKVLSEDALTSPVNKRGETFDTLLSYGLAKKKSLDYYDRENETINKTDARKAAHQGEHALKTLTMTDENIMESMARVLGLDVTSKDWREELKSLEADLGDWKQLHERKTGLRG